MLPNDGNRTETMCVTWIVPFATCTRKGSGAGVIRLRSFLLKLYQTELDRYQPSRFTNNLPNPREIDAMPVADEEFSRLVEARAIQKAFKLRK